MPKKLRKVGFTKERIKNIKPTFMVSDWKHTSQCYIRKAYGRKEGGHIREKRHAGGMRR